MILFLDLGSALRGTVEAFCISAMSDLTPGASVELSVTISKVKYVQTQSMMMELAYLYLTTSKRLTNNRWSQNVYRNTGSPGAGTSAMQYSNIGQTHE